MRYATYPTYAVVEISLTIGDRDITRAAGLEEATGVKTFAVAIGKHIEADNTRTTMVPVIHSSKRQEIGGFYS